MESQEFKKEFCAMAKQYGFKTAYGCCYKESAECLFVLELQRSYYSKLYYLNMRTYIQGVFGREYAFHKNLKRDMGDVYNRPPKSYHPIFDLEEEMTDESRLVLLDACFNDFIIPYSEKNLSVSGIRECAASRVLLLLPAVRDEIDRLYPVCNQEYKNRL